MAVPTGPRPSPLVSRGGAVKAASPPSLLDTGTRTWPPFPGPTGLNTVLALPEIPISMRVVLQAAKSRAVSLVQGESYSEFVSGVDRASQKGPVCCTHPPTPNTGSTADNSWQPAPLTPGGRG